MATQEMSLKSGLPLMTNGNAHTSEQFNVCGLRNPASSTNAYHIMRPEANCTVLNTTAVATIGGAAANDTHLLGIYAAATLTGTCVINGFADQASAAATFVLPAATPAGFKDFFGAINSAGALTVRCDNAAELKNVLILWRPV